MVTCRLSRLGLDMTLCKNPQWRSFLELVQLTTYKVVCKLLWHRGTRRLHLEPRRDREGPSGFGHDQLRCSTVAFALPAPQQSSTSR